MKVAIQWFRHIEKKTKPPWHVVDRKSMAVAPCGVPHGRRNMDTLDLMSLRYHRFIERIERVSRKDILGI
jgi:hypothetical protein